MNQSTTQQNNYKLLKGFKFIELEAGTKKPLYSFDEFITDITNIDNAGVLISKDIIVVDFDSNREIAENILNLFPTFAVKTTRGAHLYYKLPKNHNITSKTKVITAAGVVVDYKTGANNKSALAVIKQDGLLREFYNISEQINELPLLLYPISKSKTDLSGLTNGEGRNSELYKHLLNIFEQVPGAKKEIIAGIAEFINNNVFNDSLEEKELKNIIKSVIKHL